MCVLRAWKVGRKVLLFSVALETHPLSIPHLISSQPGPSPLSVAESIEFFSGLWHWHTAENCGIKQKERGRGYGLAEADFASRNTRLARAVWREVLRNEERWRGRKRENPFSFGFLLQLWSCSLIWVSCVHSVIRRKHQTNRRGEMSGEVRIEMQLVSPTRGGRSELEELEFVPSPEKSICYQKKLFIHTKE